MLRAFFCPKKRNFGQKSCIIFYSFDFLDAERFFLKNISVFLFSWCLEAFFVFKKGILKMSISIPESNKITDFLSKIMYFLKITVLRAFRIVALHQNFFGENRTAEIETEKLLVII